MENTQEIIHRNKRYYMLAAALYAFASSFLGGGFTTPFYVNNLGMNAVEISLVSTFGTIASATGYFILAVRPPRNMRRALIISSFLLCINPLVLITNLFTGRFALLVPALCVTGAMFSLAGAVKNTGEYSVTPLLFPRNEYGEMSAKCGIIGGIVAIGISLAGALFASADTSSRYMLYFVIDLVAYLLSAIAIFRYRLIDDLEPSPPESDAPKEKQQFSGGFVQKLWILAPHVIRGVVNVGVSYIVLIAMKNITFSTSGQSMLVTINSAALLLACFCFMRIERFVRSGAIIFVSYVICGVCAVLACLTQSETMFLVLNGAFLISSNIKDYAIPAGVIYSTRTEDLPFISSVRMLASIIPALVLTTPVALLIETINPGIVMLGTSIIGILGGWMYFVQYKDSYKQSAK